MNVPRTTVHSLRNRATKAYIFSDHKEDELNKALIRASQGGILVLHRRMSSSVCICLHKIVLVNVNEFKDSAFPQIELYSVKP